jgi:predicted AlkP superfamily phosphohydrolase/phosphomutase
VPAATRVLYLAFDACDREVVRSLVARGELPTFAWLFDNSATADVEPSHGVYISTNWPSFSTGLDPDHHHYLCWVDVDPETYEWVETSPAMVEGRPFWHELAEAGHRVAVFDVPHALVDPASDAVQLLEWGCHDRHLGTRSVPLELVAEIDALVGPHPVGRLDEQRPLNFAPCDFVHRAGEHRTHAESVALWEDLLLAVERKQQASLALLDRGDWSLFAVVFGETHCVGHQLWAAHDPDHPRHDPTLVALIGDPVREMYRRMDAVLAAHLDRVDDDTTVYVQLSHGMGPHYDGTHLLDIILQRLHEADDVRRGWRTRAARAAVGRVPAAWQARALGAVAGPMRRRVDASPPGPNEPWTLPLRERRWFQVPNNAPGAIRMNLRGRESNGQVDPAEYDRVCDDLARWLREIVNIDTGEPLVTEVYRADSVYDRQPDDRMPDLFVEWNTAAPIERVYSPRIGVVLGTDPQWRTGDHRRHGMLAARGPGIRHGHRSRAVVMRDVGVTLAAALGHEVRHVDGQPRADLAPTPFGRPPADDQMIAVVAPPDPAPTSLATRLAAEHRATRQLAEHVDVRERQLDARVNRTAADLEVITRRVRDLEREASIRTVTDWVCAAEVEETLTVTIVLPTRDRSSKLPRAIESVFAQDYPRWELVVVDDGSVDETADVLAKFVDPRLRVVRTEGVGVCAARNHALDVATGDVVVYLDDDNVMTAWWCKAVVWAFTQRPGTQVLYGARIIDDIVRARREGQGALPSIQFEPFDLEVLTEHNFTDMNVLAHRAGLAEARFDESVSTYGDWDLFWRLTRADEPLELPVIACHYSTDGDDRLSDHPDDLRDRAAIRAKFKRLLAES